MQQKKPCKFKRLNDSNKSACSSSLTPLGKKTNHVFPVSAKQMTPFIMEGRQHPIRLRGDMQPKPTGSRERRRSWASPRHPNVLSKWVAFQLHSSLSRTSERLKYAKFCFVQVPRQCWVVGNRLAWKPNWMGKPPFPEDSCHRFVASSFHFGLFFFIKLKNTAVRRTFLPLRGFAYRVSGLWAVPVFEGKVLLTLSSDAGLSPHHNLLRSKWSVFSLSFQGVNELLFASFEQCLPSL